jgi:hypothetical protein
MSHTTTHTFAFVKVSKKTFTEIEDILVRAGYQNQILEENGEKVIDMNGLALVTKEPYGNLRQN